MKRLEILVVVADSEGGRFFRVEAGSALVPVLGGEIAGDVQPSREINADRPGRSFDRSGSGRHAMEPRTDPKRFAKAGLAHEIAQLLDAERKKNAFDALVVVAPPQFLGDLRSTMPKPVRDLIVAEVNKDLSKLAPHQLSEQLGDVLKIRPPL